MKLRAVLFLFSLLVISQQSNAWDIDQLLQASIPVQALGSFDFVANEVERQPVESRSIERQPVAAAAPAKPNRKSAQASTPAAVSTTPKCNCDCNCGTAQSNGASTPPSSVKTIPTRGGPNKFRTPTTTPSSGSTNSTTRVVSGAPTVVQKVKNASSANLAVSGQPKATTGGASPTTGAPSKPSNGKSPLPGSPTPSGKLSTGGPTTDGKVSSSSGKRFSNTTKLPSASTPSGRPIGTGMPLGTGRPAGTNKIQLMISPKPGNLSNAGKGMTPNFIPPQPNLQLSKGSLNYGKVQFGNSSGAPSNGSLGSNGISRSLPMATTVRGLVGGKMSTLNGSPKPAGSPRPGSKNPLSKGMTTVRSLLSSAKSLGRSPPSNSSLNLGTSPRPPTSPSNSTTAKSNLNRPRRSVDDIEIIGLIGVFRKVGYWAFSMVHQLDMFY